MLERRDLLGVGRVDLLLGLAHALELERVLRRDHVGHRIGGVELQGGAAFGEGRRRLQRAGEPSERDEETHHR